MSAEEQELLDCFLEEVADLLQRMEEALLRLDPESPDSELVDSALRAVHSIKGNAGPFGFHELVDLSHAAETLLEELREGERRLGLELIDLLLEVCDCLRATADAHRDREATPDARIARARALLRHALASRGAPGGEASASPAPGEGASSEPSARRGPGLSLGRPVASIRVSTERIDALLSAVGELVIAQSVLRQCALEPASSAETRFGLARGLLLLERNVQAIQESVLRIRMLPIRSAFERLPRIARELGRSLGKQVDLEISGEQTELDKTVLELLGDPLVHLLRNAIDHGIEAPELRRAAGKSARGRIRLHASPRGGQIAVEISDDGAGLDLDAIRRRGEALGMLDPAARTQGPDELAELLFRPGFSTTAALSEVSGRGVGLDVVRRNLSELGGTVQVSSRPGEGTSFCLRLPLTVAIVDGQLVRVCDQVFVLPSAAVSEFRRVEPHRLHRLPGGSALYQGPGEVLPLASLADLLALPGGDRGSALLVVVDVGGARTGLFVDELLGRQQVVIKSVDQNCGPVPAVSGATILGDGSVALILDVPRLVRAGLDRARAGRGADLPLRVVA